VKVYVPFLFAEPTLAVISYMDMIENYPIPQIQQDTDKDFNFQQDGAHPHFHREVTSHLNHKIFAWIGRGGRYLGHHDRLT
jgi:hypothetical protein